MTPTPVEVVDARSARRLNNALTLTFYSAASSEPFATAVQGAAGSFGGKLAILFGFRNGGKGIHRLRFASGGTLVVRTEDYAPSVVSRDGAVLATITKEATTTAVAADGAVLFTFSPVEVDAVTDDRYSIAIADGTGAPVGTVDLIRTNAGWDSDALLDLVLDGLDASTGGSLPSLFRGTRLVLFRSLSDRERDVLLGVCVDLGIGARAYFTAMGTVTAWG